jgi:DNA-binding transcriptional LysR family regulator
MSRTGLQDLDAVMAVARRGSFRIAAVDLGVSTTALSHVIAKLESGLGVRLFNRTTRSVALTDAGRLFVDRVGPPLSSLHDALVAVQSRQETPSGTLRINAAPFAARQILQPLVLEFLRRFPEMHVDLVTEGRLVDIVADGFDLGVRVANLVPSDMIAVSLGRPQRYAVVASPAYLADREPPGLPGELLEHPCIRVRLPDGALFRWQFEQQGRISQIDVRGPVTLDEATLARAAVLDGIGIGFFLEQDVLRDIRNGDLVRLLDEWTPSFSGLALYYPGRRHPSAGLAAFIALARDVAAREAQQ